MAGWQDDPEVTGADAPFAADPVVEAAEPDLGGTRAALQGASFGFGDEVVGALVAAARKVAGDERSFVDIYEDVSQNEREQIAQYRDASPMKAFLAEGGGALLTGLGAGAKVLGSKAVQKVSAKLPRWLTTAGIGAVEAGAYGAGAAEPGERLEGGAKGAAVGFVATPVVATVARVGGRLLGDLGKYAYKRLTETPSGEAVRIIREAAKQAGLKGEDIVRRYEELGPDGLLLDTDENFRALTRALADRFGPAKRLAREALEDRQLGQVGRLVREIEDASGFAADDFVDSMRTLAQQRADKAAPFYDAAWSAQPSQSMVALAQRPAMKAALARAARDAANEGDTATEGSFKLFHYAKMALDGQIGRLQRAGDKVGARNLTRLKNELLQEMDEVSPDYKAGRDLYASDSSLLEAADAGRKFFSLSMDEFGDLVTGMSQSEREMFKRGAVKAIADKLGDSQLTHNNAQKLINTQSLQAKLGTLFKSKEAAERFVKQAVAEREFSRSRTVVSGGSPTSQNLAGQEGVDEVVSGITSVLGDDKVGIATKIFQKVFGDGKPTPETIKAATDLLLKRNMTPQQIRKLFRESGHRVTDEAVDTAINALRGSPAPTAAAALEHVSN